MEAIGRRLVEVRDHTNMQTFFGDESWDSASLGVLRAWQDRGAE